MAGPPEDFPRSPHAILDPEIRWYPSEDTLRLTSADCLLPPLVAALRRRVKEFRDSGYVGASETSKSLLNWWFKGPRLVPGADGMTEFQYFFAQQEALETIVYLYDVVGVKDKFDLMRFDSTGDVTANMFPEAWRRFVIKMATGTGKTKVMSLALAWSYFHRLYEPDSDLARNFLIITPNIIVLDRICKDFEGLRIFHSDPVIPDNGHDGREWQNDFFRKITVHKQDDLRILSDTGNIFLTNIHRVYTGKEIPPSPDDENTMDYFLGPGPKGDISDSRVDLGMVVRDISELMVLNDEAHHIHNEKMAWFQSIQDIHNRLLQKDSALALQLDVTATPKHNDGTIFAQTVSDYPLIEAIWQDVVKHPVLPDNESRKDLRERQSARYTEKYADYIHLGVVEWRKSYEEHRKTGGKKSILFVMTDDTRNCDDLAAHLESNYPDLKGAVLVIHTKKNGEISEAPSSGKSREELEKLRKAANEIDHDEKYKAIVSVLVLKEGWDVRNVTTIVGLRAYSAKSNILPEQTLGRGLRRMFHGDNDGRIEETVSVVGTDAFMEFVESIEREGVALRRASMGKDAPPQFRLLIEVDRENPKKDIDALDIALPVLTARAHREYENLVNLEIAALQHRKAAYRQFSEEDRRKIVFRYIARDEDAHETVLDASGFGDYRHVLDFFTQTVMKAAGFHRIQSFHAALYGKIKAFIRTRLFDRPVDLEDVNTLRNLAEPAVTKTVIETFRKAVNDLTVTRREEIPTIRGSVNLSKTRPFSVNKSSYTVPKKSVFNRIVGDRNFELEFAEFLDGCADIVSHGKNYFAVGFKLDYIKDDGSLSNYYPDFFVKKSDSEVYIVETKGREDPDDPHKVRRLREWCEDVNQVQSEVRYGFVYVDQAGFNRYRPKTFGQLLESFREYREPPLQTDLDDST